MLVLMWIVFFGKKSIPIIGRIAYVRGTQVLVMKIIKYMEPSSRGEILLEFYEYHGVSIMQWMYWF